MSTEVSEKLYTVEEFLNLEWPDDDDTEYELIGGRIVARQGSTSGKHGDVVARLVSRLDQFGGVGAEEKRLGKVYSGASCTLGLPQGLNNPKPAVCFVVDGRTPEDFDGPIPVAPDLVIEVNSPSDTDERRFEKLQAYQQAGLSLIWSIHMLEKFVVVYRKGELYPQFFSVKDELDGGEVLPGFRLEVNALFKK